MAKLTCGHGSLNLFEHSPALRNYLQEHLRSFERREIPRERRRAASVCLTVCHEAGQPAIVVTRRSASLRAHSRQWALPGGRRDQGETAVQAALRELEEEVGLHAAHSDVLGVLDDYATRSGYVITPVVVWASSEIGQLSPNPDEVEFAKSFSFRELARRDSPVLQQIEQSDSDVLSMNFYGDRIYAPTGAMLYQFREVAMFGRHTRVAHFEQPLFAWK